MTNDRAVPNSPDAPPAYVRWGVVLPLGLALALWAPGIAGGSIVNGDDAIYAIVVRSLLDGAPYFHVAGWRPPLFYLLSCASASVLGLNELGLRFASLLGGLATVAATWAAGRALYRTRPAVALWAATLVACTGQLFLFARRVRGLDLLLTALVAATVTVAAHAGNRRRRWAGVGALIGLTFLTKSVVFVVAGPAVAVLWWTSCRSGRERLGTALGTAVGAVAVGSLWPLWMWMSGAGWAARDHIEQHVVRRAVDASMVAAEGSGPGYYVAQLVAHEGVLGLLALGAIAFLALRAVRRDLPAAVALAWIAGVLVPFSVASTRLPHYALPAYPALVIGVAAMLATGAEAVGRRWAVHVAGAALAVVSVVASPIGIMRSWADADYSPHLEAAARVATEVIGNEGTLAVWNEYHVAAAFYFRGRTLLWTDDEGFYAAYRGTHGFTQGVDFDRVATDGVGAALAAAAPACLVVRDDRRGTGFDALERTGIWNTPLPGATLYCVPGAK